MVKFKSPAIHRTPLYRAKAAYRNMKIRCENANGKSPSYQDVKLLMSLDEWLNWSLPIYEKLIGENQDIILNAARIGDSGNYEIGNIEIIPKSKNLADMKFQVNMIALKCCFCNSIFERPERYVKSKTKNGHKIYCSRKCSGKGSMGAVTEQ